MREVKPSFKLKPVLSFKTKIAQIKELAKGTYIGYGCTYVTNKKSKIAVLPVGYYDGYDRRLSNCGRVLINGKFAPVRGRIFMNMMVVDVTEIPNVKVENEVTIIGFDGKNQVSADELAKRVGTINYEITTRLNERIERKVKLL